jgi:hypothetical protein
MVHYNYPSIYFIHSNSIVHSAIGEQWRFTWKEHTHTCTVLWILYFLRLKKRAVSPSQKIRKKAGKNLTKRNFVQLRALGENPISFSTTHRSTNTTTTTAKRTIMGPMPPTSKAAKPLATPRLIRSITIDRCSNFTSGGANGNDINLLSQLYKARTSSGNACYPGSLQSSMTFKNELTVLS